MPQLTSAEFIRAQTTFYNEVMKNPVIVTLLTEQVVPVVGDDYQQMMQVQKERFTSNQVKCLYKQQISDRERSRLGLTQAITGLIYIPPQELMDVFGTFTLDPKKVLVRFMDYDANAIYEVSKVQYLPPLFNSCVAVMYAIKNTSKAIDVNDLDSQEQLNS